jgi:hypothetical protein
MALLLSSLLPSCTNNILEPICLHLMSGSLIILASQFGAHCQYIILSTLTAIGDTVCKLVHHGQSKTMPLSSLNGGLWIEANNHILRIEFSSMIDESKR